MNPEALILRRCYPVPVTFADLRAAHTVAVKMYSTGSKVRPAKVWTAALKETTGALDEVYAVVDGREVRVAAVAQGDTPALWRWHSGDSRILPSKVCDLLDAADKAGYWEHPHEVRVELEERLISHDEVACAVMVGQQYMESLSRHEKVMLMIPTSDYSHDAIYGKNAYPNERKAAQ